MRQHKEFDKPFLSPTRIISYLACSLRYKFQYIDKIKIPPTSPHIIYGVAVHVALEQFYKALLKKKLSKLELFDSFEQTWYNSIEFSENEIDWKSSGQKDYFFKTALKALDNFYELHKNDPPPIFTVEPGTLTKNAAVELEFNVPIISNNEERQDYTLYGFIDLVQEVDKKLKIIDHKTAAREYTNFKILTDLQLIAYAYAFRYLLKQNRFPDVKKDKEDVVCFNILLKNKDGTIKTYEKVVRDEDINRFLYVIETMIKGIENSIFVPNYGMGCEWCDYKETCQEWRI